MIGLVLVTHGRLAQEFISAMEHMVGPQTHLRAVCIGPEDDIERRQREIAAAAKSVDVGSGVIIATDMFGGTPCNLALTLAGARQDRSAGGRQPAQPDQADRHPHQAAAGTGGERSDRGGPQIYARRSARSGRACVSEPLRAIAKITNKRGLHARASAKIVEASARFQSEITIVKDGTAGQWPLDHGPDDAGGQPGQRNRRRSRRAGRGDAMTAMLALIEAKFGEE